MKIISDMSICRPGEAMSRQRRDGHWCLVDYATDEFEGTMVWTLFEDETPELTLPLGVTGGHDIYVGILYSSILGEQQLGLKLSGEQGFHRLEKEMFFPKDGPIGRKFDYMDLVESFWRSVDLTGKDLIVSGPLDGKMGCLAYVRLIPCSNHPPADPSARRLIAMTDGELQVRDYYKDMKTMDDTFAPLKDSDFFLVLYGAAVGDSCMYETNVGVRMSDFWTGQPFCKKMVRTLGHLLDQGVKPLKEVIGIAHDFDLQFYGSMRMMGPYLPPGHHVPGTLYDRHPEYRCRDKDGNPVPHLSLAFPAVRARYVSILQEMAEMGTDGVHVLFNRGWPWVLYEDITVREFQEKVGRDPRTIALDDPEWLAHRASYVTQFLREIRAAADGVGRTQGRRIGTAYHVLDNPGNCLFYGLDIRTWIEENLVDILIPTSLHFTDAHSSKDGQVIRPFVDLARGTDCKVYPDYFPRRALPESFIPMAIVEYEAGANGLCFWDTQSLTVRSSEFAVRRDLGHREDLKAWQAAGKGKDYFKIVPLRRLVDYPVDRRYWPLTNG